MKMIKSNLLVALVLTVITFNVYSMEQSGKETNRQLQEQLIKLINETQEDDYNPFLNVNYAKTRENYLKKAKNELGYLCQQGLDVNSTFGQNKSTMLMMAANMSNDIIITLLLDKGVDVNSVTTDTGSTALMFAVQGSGAMVNIVKSIEILAHYPTILINQQDFKGNTALMYAIMMGYSPSVKALLKAGANPRLGNNEGLTPLQAAQLIGKQEIINLIEEAINPARAA